MAYVDDILALSPVHYWQLDANLNDQGTGTALTLTGSGTALVTPGVHPGNTNAREWGRGADNLAAASSTDLDNLVTTQRTVSMMLNVDLDTLSQTLVSIGNTAQGMHCFLAAGVVPACSVVSGGTTVTAFADRPLSVGETANVVFRYNAGTAEIFIDGILVASESGGPASVAASTVGADFGGDNSADQVIPIPGGTFTIYTHGGRMSDIAIWNTALSDTDIYDTLFASSAQARTATAVFTNVPPKTEVRIFDAATLAEVGTGVEYQAATGTVTISYPVTTTLQALVVLVNVEDPQIVVSSDTTLPREGASFPADLLFRVDRVYDGDFIQEFAPESSVPPTISGTSEVGQTLTVTDTGEWGAGTEPFTFTYQWTRGGVDISGATNSTYVLVGADDGESIRCDVTATNNEGSDTASSNAISLISSGLVYYARRTLGGVVTTTPTVLDYDTEDRNDGSAYAVSSGTITPPSGRYFIAASAAWIGSGVNNRCGPVIEIRKNGVMVSGSGGSGYQRDTSNDAAWMTGNVVVECNGTDTIEVYVWRDSDSSAGAWDATRTWLFMVSIDASTAFAHYTATGTASMDGVGVYADVALGTTEVETNPALISRSGSDITLAAGHTYLITGGVSFDSTTNRTARFCRLTADSTHISGSTGYCMLRNANNEFGRPSTFAIIEVTGSPVTINLQARGPTRVSGAVMVAGGAAMVPAETGIQVVQMKSGFEWFASSDATMGQNIAVSSVDINFARTADHVEPSLITTSAAVDAVTAAKAFDAFVHCGIRTLRSVRSGTRLTREGVLARNGTNEFRVANGSYNRGDQGNEDVDDNAKSIRGFIPLTLSDELRVRVTEAPDTGWNDGSTTLTSNEPVGFYIFNLATV